MSTAMPAAPDPAEKALAAVEQQLDCVTQALRSGEPAALESASQQLRGVSVAMARTLEAAVAADRLSAPLRKRLQRVAQLMRLQREQLARRTAGVERALAVVLPQAPQGGDSATYGRAGGVAGRGSVARIYASHG